MTGTYCAYGLDRKLSDLWRFSTKSVSSHIKFAQYLYALIHLTKKNPSLMSILPLDDLLTLALYHLRSLIVKKYSDGFDVIRPFRTVYLESICQTYSSLTQSHCNSIDSDQFMELDNDELVARINQNEKLIKSARLFSGFCRQKQYSLVKCRQKKPFMNPLYDGINKNIDNLKYENERIMLFIGKFPKPNVKHRSERKLSISNCSIDTNNLMKMEMLKISREIKNLAIRTKFMCDYKIDVYNNLSTALINVQHLSKHKIERYISRKQRSNFVARVNDIKNNNITDYKDSIHTLQQNFVIDQEFVILSEVIDHHDEKIVEVNKSQTTEDVSDVMVTSDRSYHVSNSFYAKSEQSFKHDYVNDLFRFNTEELEDSDIDNRKSDSFKCIHYYHLSSGQLVLDNEFLNCNDHAQCKNLSTNTKTCRRHYIDKFVSKKQDCPIVDIVEKERESTTIMNEPIIQSDADSVEDCEEISTKSDSQDTVADHTFRIKTVEDLIEPVDTSESDDNSGYVIVDRDSGKNIECLIGDMYRRSCNVDNVDVVQGETIALKHVDVDLVYKEVGKLSVDDIKSSSTCAINYGIVDCDNCLSDERLNGTKSRCYEFARKFKICRWKYNNRT
ncbi:hypothetical protein BMR1_02g03895 [Babesia microti strain RI]|uniref:Uncharacterized protein n=1 Tax=Babesia microti (strain RI) TaxID=1133968 RepID=A0A1R4AAX9_BABMR|nr:hypothetical protein BMR1_02g03895 [Babesia microti strain RI]SJK86150.1 hypothetical protein BMR1_02g03895 [Babesia microti strain RI]|eukprot:XP_021338343.1 hypothetical protein BMR1_02g03895 [Babesia microti strain RI]